VHYFAGGRRSSCGLFFQYIVTEKIEYDRGFLNMIVNRSRLNSGSRRKSRGGHYDDRRYRLDMTSRGWRREPRGRKCYVLNSLGLRNVGFGFRLVQRNGMLNCKRGGGRARDDTDMINSEFNWLECSC
jgi:hypothetical protein